MEEAKHDTDADADDSDKDVEEVDSSSTTEAKQGHHTVKHGFAQGEIHEVEPHSGSHKIALDANQSDSKHKQVQCEQETSERVEIICHHESEQGLNDDQGGHCYLHAL